MKEDIPTVDDCRPFLEPITSLVLTAFWDSWHWANTLIESDPTARARMMLNSSTIAGMVSDAFGYFAFPKLVAMRGVRERRIGRSHLAVLSERLLVRFKKMTTDLRTMSIETETNHRIINHQEILPSGRRLTTINLGYTQSQIGAVITGVYFACPDGNRPNHWVLPIYQAEEGQMTMWGGTPPMPSDQDVAQELNVDIRIKRRKGKMG